MAFMTGWWFGTWILFSVYWEIHHPNWRTHIFLGGGSTTKQTVLKVTIVSYGLTIKPANTPVMFRVNLWTHLMTISPRTSQEFEVIESVLLHQFQKHCHFHSVRSSKVQHNISNIIQLWFVQDFLGSDWAMKILPSTQYIWIGIWVFLPPQKRLIIIPNKTK